MSEAGTLGRNDPCRCGSGKKYKHCCLQSDDAVEFRWRQVRAAEGRLVPDLLELSASECPPEFLSTALQEFFLWDDGLETHMTEHEVDAFFVPWFVYQYVADPQGDERVAGAPAVSLASLYLERCGAALSVVERSFLTAASTSPSSYHLVTRVVPGREIGLRDLLTGSEAVVKERTASMSVEPGVLIFARVVTVDDVSVMTGVAPLIIPPEWHLPILDARASFSPEGGMLTRDDVWERDLELRELYFHIADKLLNPTPPELRNTDGDRLVFTTLRYRLRCTPQAAFDRLASLARVPNRDVELLLRDATWDDGRVLRAVTFAWNKRGNRMRSDWDSTMMGTIAIEERALRIEVNSRSRARRIEREIVKRLGADAVLESRTEEPVEQVLDSRDITPRDRIEDLEQEKLQQQPEVQALLREESERYWEGWLDTRVPALGNQTPREAARSAAGRERLEALLTEFSWHAAQRSNQMSPDVALLRRRLGLT